MFIFESAPFPSCHASTIVETENGRFLAAWFGGRAEGANDVKIWQSRFDGMRWSAPEIAAEERGFPCWNPVLFKSRAGSLMLFYKAGPSPMTWTGYVRRSRDQGRTWGAIEALPAGLYGPIKNKPIQLADGAILAPTSVESHRAWASWIEKSTDDGQTWRRCGPIQVPGRPHGNIQPTLFALTETRILALCRSRGMGRIVQSESNDRGETWAAARTINVANPGSGIDGVRATNGALYLIYNDSAMLRTPLCLARSTDNGASWRKVHTYETQVGEFSYPSIIQANDGRLHAVYTYNRRHIKYVALDPQDLRAE